MLTKYEHFSVQQTKMKKANIGFFNKKVYFASTHFSVMTLLIVDISVFCKCVYYFSPDINLVTCTRVAVWMEVTVKRFVHHPKGVRDFNPTP